MRVGIEAGGTFTDLVAVDGACVRAAKAPSAPASPDEGAMQAIDAAGLNPGAIEELVHGSTDATNAIHERKGTAVCLFVTNGIRDVLLHQRHDKDAIHDLRYSKPGPVVRRPWPAPRRRWKHDGVRSAGRNGGTRRERQRDPPEGVPP